MDALSGFFTIDVVGVLHIDCLRRTNFRDVLLTSTLTPIVIMTLDADVQLGRMAIYGGAFQDGKAFKW